MKYLYPLNAINVDGTVVLLYDKEEVVSFIRDHGRFHDKHVVWYYDYIGYHFKQSHNNWIVRDDRGQIVKYDDFLDKYVWDRYNKRQKKIRDIAAKGLPIPGTGCSKAGYKFRALKKKSGGYHTRIKAAEKYKYDVKDYEGHTKPRGINFTNPWW